MMPWPRCAFATVIVACAWLTPMSAAAIVGGSPSDASQDAVVMLVYSGAATGAARVCTAALLAPKLVLTARHCVADTDLDVECASSGQAVRGGTIRKNHAPESLFIFTGATRPSLDRRSWAPAAVGAEIVDDGATNLCDHDLALVVLDRAIADVPLADVRLDRDVAAGEKLRTIGWGITTEEVEPRVRQQRGGVTVTRVGPSDEAPTLTPSELLYDESTCTGDSGGPVLSEATGAVVAVVSRGGNGTTPSEPSGACIGADNLATRTARFRDLVMRAYALAGAEPRLEPAPSEDDGCSSAPGRARTPPASRFAAVVLVAAGLVVLGRRWRVTPGT